MHQITLNLTFESLPPIILRKRHALILVRNENNKFLLGKKKHYPNGISRLVGGGLEPKEDPQLGAARELNEELQVGAKSEDLTPLAQVTASIKFQEKTITLVTWLYFYQLKQDKVTANSDLDDLAYLNENDYKELIKKYQHLSHDLHPKLGFAWFDYGQLYSRMHQIALDSYYELVKN